MAASTRVVIDARLPDGASGGVQQWIIGLAAALSALPVSTEEYWFLVDEGQGAWLEPYLGGACRLLVPSTVPVKAGPLARLRGRLKRGGRRAVAAVPWLRTAFRSRAFRRSSAWLLGTNRALDLAGTAVVHFPKQTAFVTSIPSIYQPWDLQHLHLPEFFTAEELVAREAAYRAYCEQASRIVVATKWVKADLAAQYRIPAEKIAVVNPPPVTEAYVRPTVEQVAAVARGLGLPKRFVFYPAQTWGHKNHERLFEALHTLRERGLVVPMVCTGHQNEKFADLLRTVERLGLEADVQFLGFLNPLEVQVVYRSATALVFPSLYEGWGLPIVEAFEQGLPVACSNATSLPDLVSDAALVFDPLDQSAIAAAIERVWTDADLRGHLIERGRARVALFDWDETARTMRALYRSVAGLELSDEDASLIARPPVV